MVEIIYNKLVRDNIPKIINDQENQSCEYRIIENDDEYFKYLVLKMKEEIQEFYETPTSEEMADVVEVLNEIQKLKNINQDVVEATRIKKLKVKGGFNLRYILERVLNK